MLLEVKDLEVYYGKVYALKGILLGVEKETVVALIGANGAGKSTLLKTISGTVSPTSGEIWFKGERIDKVKPHKIVERGIAHVPEGRRIFAPLTVSENLEMGAYLRRDKQGIEKDKEQMYRRFPILGERRNLLGGGLSGGEQQMLAVARALMARPELILMDEPSIGLSPILLKEVADIIREIHQEGVTLILVEQNAHMALELADTAYVLKVGMVALHGAATELLKDERVKKAYLGD